MKMIKINIFILFRSYFAQCIVLNCYHIYMLKYSFLRRLPMHYEKNGFGCITLNVNFQGRRADVLMIFLHLTQFNYLFRNYFITCI